MIATEQEQPCPQQVTALSHEDVAQKGQERAQDPSSEEAFDRAQRSHPGTLKTQENHETALGEGTATLLEQEKGLKAEQAVQGRAADSLFKEMHLQLENTTERSQSDTMSCGESHKDMSKFMRSQL